METKKKSAISNICTFLWNPKTKEFCGRDGASWAKISLFYAVFYTFLASFFIGMLAVFVGTLDMQKPTYYGKTSTMNVGKDSTNRKNGVNPGMGFRPQIDVEAQLVSYSLEDKGEESNGGRLAKALKIFLENKYMNKTENSIDCNYQDTESTREKFNQGKFCSFDYNSILTRSTYTFENDFGYMDNGPLMLLKVNKIYDWIPSAYGEVLPDALNAIQEGLNKTDSSLVREFNDIVQNNIIVKCKGENSMDEDVVDNLKITYYSIGKQNKFEDKFGIIPFYYYPYLNQVGYEIPAVFIKFDFKNSDRPGAFLTRGVATNIICQAYASNIDSNDKFNRRGMTSFTLYVR